MPCRHSNCHNLCIVADRGHVKHLQLKDHYRCPAVAIATQIHSTYIGVVRFTVQSFLQAYNPALSVRDFVESLCEPRTKCPDACSTIPIARFYLETGNSWYLVLDAIPLPFLLVYFDYMHFRYRYSYLVCFNQNKFFEHFIINRLPDRKIASFFCPRNSYFV